MIFPQFIIYVLIYDYLKFRKGPSITSQEIANYISVALAVALSVCNLANMCMNNRSMSVCHHFCYFRFVIENTDIFFRRTYFEMSEVKTAISL